MVCRLCGAQALYRSIQGRLYGDCPACGYLGLDAAYFPTPEAERTRYLQHRNDPGEPGYRGWILAFLEKAVFPAMETRTLPPAILDFGSGPTAALATILAEYGAQASSYDPYFAPETEWHHRDWDIIIVHEVAEHLREPAATLGSLAARLKPGGRLALRTQSPPDEEERLADWWYLRDCTHLGFFRKSSFGHVAAATALLPPHFIGPDIAILEKSQPEVPS